MKTILAQWAIPFCLVLTLLLGACGEKKEEHADSEGSDNDGTDTATTLSAPANFSVTAGDSKVTLDWVAVSGASSYTVYWGTSTGISSSSTTITSISTDNYTHSSLTNDTTYYYKVAAVDSSGTGTLSSEANATPASDGTLMGGAIQGSPLSLSTEVSTFAGGSGDGDSTDGTGTSATFYAPIGITTDGTNLFVADYYTIRKIVIASGEVTTLAGSGEEGSADATGTSATFYRPTGITTDGTNRYVIDSYNYTIRKIVIATGVVTTLAGSPGNEYEDEGDGADEMGDGTGTSAGFSWAGGITTDGTNLYVADTNRHTIRKIVIATGVVSTLAGTAGTSGSINATGTSATFNRPTGITTDGTNLYVAERSNHTIRKIVIATGVVTTLAGTAGTSGSNDATGTSATFNSPRGITTDGTNLYVAESENHKIRKIVIATGVVTTLAGSGSQGMDDGTGTSASFSNPQRVITDGTNLYVTDEEDKGRISKIQ